MFKKSYCFLRLINVSNYDEYKRSLEFRGFTLIREYAYYIRYVNTME